MAKKEKEVSLLALASKAVPRMALQDIALIGSSMERTRDIPGGLEGTFELTSAFKVNHEFHETEKRLEAVVGFRASGRLLAEEMKLDLFTITSEFLVTYSVNDDSEIDGEAIIAFAKLNGTYNAWPYWREYLQNCTVRMGLPPAVVPLVSVQSILESIARQEQDESDNAEPTEGMADSAD